MSIINSSSVEKAIIKTLVYRDLFDYPLTAEEVWRFLIDKKAARTMVEKALVRLETREIIDEQGGFYFLSGRKAIVPLRRKREVLSKKKMQRAKRYARLLRLVPWVRAVFATGAIAAGNAEEESDLDILTITSPRRLWLTRLFVFLILIALGVKRKPKVKAASNKVCPNMFLSVAALWLPGEEQNLYTAYEIAQAKPLWERGSIHQLFLVENDWVKRFLPNWKSRYRDISLRSIQRYKGSSTSLCRCILVSLYHLTIAPLFDFLEGIVYRLQLAYMAGRRTKEIVTRERILFHSQDLPSKVLGSYKKRLRGILTV